MHSIAIFVSFEVFCGIHLGPGAARGRQLAFTQKMFFAADVTTLLQGAFDLGGHAIHLALAIVLDAGDANDLKALCNKEIAAHGVQGNLFRAGVKVAIVFDGNLLGRPAKINLEVGFVC